MGKLLQTVQATVGKVSTTTQIPADDTIPQSTEGGEFITLAITPQSATSTLDIFFRSHVEGPNSGLCVALFKDSDTDATSTTRLTIPSGIDRSVMVHFSVPSASTDARTYKIRMGCNQTGTLTNYTTGADDDGGTTPLSRLTIMEVEA